MAEITMPGPPLTLTGLQLPLRAQGSPSSLLRGHCSQTPGDLGSQGGGLEAFAPTSGWLPGRWPGGVWLCLGFSGRGGDREASTVRLSPFTLRAQSPDLWRKLLRPPYRWGPGLHFSSTPSVSDTSATRLVSALDSDQLIGLMQALECGKGPGLVHPW